MFNAIEAYEAERSERQGRTTDALARIAERDKALNAFTAVTRERALAKVRALDKALAQGQTPGPHVGAPFAVKNLCDVIGLPSLAGSKINRDRPPAPAAPPAAWCGAYSPGGRYSR